MVLRGRYRYGCGTVNDERRRRKRVSENGTKIYKGKSRFGSGVIEIIREAVETDDWIIADEAGFVCERCYDREYIRLPLRISEYNARAQEFIRQHQDCKRKSQTAP